MSKIIDKINIRDILKHTERLIKIVEAQEIIIANLEVRVDDLEVADMKFKEID